jgi:hypothetical protein
MGRSVEFVPAQRERSDDRSDEGSSRCAGRWGRDSQQFNVTFLFNKFNPPVVDGGQVYVANYNGGVDVYRLTQ